MPKRSKPDAAYRTEAPPTPATIPSLPDNARDITPSYEEMFYETLKLLREQAGGDVLRDTRLLGVGFRGQFTVFVYAETVHEIQPTEPDGEHLPRFVEVSQGIHEAVGQYFPRTGLWDIRGDKDVEFIPNRCK